MRVSYVCVYCICLCVFECVYMNLSCYKFIWVFVLVYIFVCRCMWLCVCLNESHACVTGLSPAVKLVRKFDKELRIQPLGWIALALPALFSGMNLDLYSQTLDMLF